MSKLKFEPEDFCLKEYGPRIDEDIARAAQAKFEKWLENQPVVWLEEKDNILTPMTGSFSPPNYRATHVGRLVAIEPIEKKCEHKNAQGDTLMGFQCADCDTDVRPMGWEPIGAE